MPITDWPEADRPRERLLRDGATALSDAELLAIFLRTGIPGKSAVDLARELLAAFDGRLERLCRASVGELSKTKGIGPAKAAQLAASLEIARRALGQRLREPDSLASPAAVRDYLRLAIGHLPHEVFMLLLLDAQNRLLAAEELFRGTLTQTSVYPREVVKRALAKNAAAVQFAHNHPSGVAEPSSADQAITQALKAALALVDIRVLDHFVVASGCEPVSLAERGLI